MSEPVEFNLTTGIPRRIGHFTILDELGSGGMGAVYRAKDEKLGNFVALKVIKPELAKEPSARERFLREARAAAMLRDHDHIVAVFDVNEIDLGDGRYLLYLVMPLLKGETLQNRIARADGKPLPLNEQLLIAREISEALAAAHDAELVHRDIKPGNVWLEARKDGSTRVKVLDFGLVRSAPDSQLTKTGLTPGTPAFMAPEQGKSSDVDHRADLWSLGVILFQMATGQLPFVGETDVDIMIKVRMDSLPSVREFNGSLSDEHVRLIEGLLEKDPKKRPRSATDVIARLREIEYSHTKEPTMPSLPVLPVVPIPKRRSSKQWAVLLMVLMVNVVLVAWLFTRPASKPTELVQNKLNPTKEERPIVSVSKEEPKKEEKKPDPPKVEEKKVVPPMLKIDLVPMIEIEPMEVEPKEPPLLVCPASAAEVKRSQQLWADYLKVKVTIEEDLGNGIKLKMVLIPPGKFRMGSEANDNVAYADQSPAREVTISKAFYVGVYEVSRGEFRKFADAEQFKDDGWKKTFFELTDDHPVVDVSWDDCQAFCEWLSVRANDVRKGRKVSLPSEAQWEYACRAGTTTQYGFGDDAKLLVKHGNGWSKEDGYEYTAPVGQFPSNAFGLHDMHGNVWEWCEDWYGPYEASANKDPLRMAKHSNDSRVIRGGSWIGIPVFCRSANRFWRAPGNRDDVVGFRICCRLD